MEDPLANPSLNKKEKKEGKKPKKNGKKDKKQTKAKVEKESEDKMNGKPH